jgi:hypothetical protein
MKIMKGETSGLNIPYEKSKLRLKIEYLEKEAPKSLEFLN